MIRTFVVGGRKTPPDHLKPRGGAKLVYQVSAHKNPKKRILRLMYVLKPSVQVDQAIDLEQSLLDTVKRVWEKHMKKRWKGALKTAKR